MKKAIVDIECSWTILPNNKRPNPSPYIETNKLVSVGVLCFNDSGIITEDYLIFNHNDWNHETGYLENTRLKLLLASVDLVIGHNLKFDMSWLYETGFEYTGKLYDTMICEYVFSKGLKRPLNLDDSCKRYGLDTKSDVLGDYRNKGINTHEVPLQELIEYGKQDIAITYQLYNKQQELIANDADSKYMEKAVTLMNDTLPAIIQMERNGIHIDLHELDKVEKEYREEYNNLCSKLQQITIDVMGHTPINLDSPEDLSCVIFSRKVKDKTSWKEFFNLGSELRNSVVKVKYSRRMSESAFVDYVRANTDRIRKTEASQCQTCLGKGKIRRQKKNGGDFKKDSICPYCQGAGLIYTPTSSYAGLRLFPLGSEFTAVGGFSTDKITLLELLKQDISDKAKDFITALLRMNAISTYLSTFVYGIRKNVKYNILHSSFNQCLTATGRLSSSQPNFQNLPRAKTFPIRKVVKSRWPEGKILSVDFKQLEFRVAAILSKDKQAEEDILNDIDIHVFTRDTITAAGQPMDRQDAKIRTFKPLFGGIKGTEAEEAYYKAFLIKYSGIDEWQKALENEALNTKQIKSPSGRIYAFPNVRRLPSGGVLGHTQIKNYMVQGLATGDINPVALIELHKNFIFEKFNSKIILSVHDDITIDVYPGEEEKVIKSVQRIFNSMNYFVKHYFNIDTVIPIEGEISIGSDWLNKTTIAA